MVRTVFFHKDIGRISREFVAVVAHSNPDHGEGDWIVGRSREHLCNIYDLPSCRSHEEMRTELSKRGLLKGANSTPTHIIYNPHDLSELARTHFMTAKNFEDKNAEAQKVLGKPVRWKHFAKARGTLDEARTLLETEDYRKCLRALKGFDAMGMKGLQSEAEKLEADVLATGEARLEEARGLIDGGEAGKAIKLLRGVSRDFAGTEAAKTAKALIARAKQ